MNSLPSLAARDKVCIIMGLPPLFMLSSVFPHYPLVNCQVNQWQPFTPMRPWPRRKLELSTVPSADAIWQWVGSSPPED